MNNINLDQFTENETQETDTTSAIDKGLNIENLRLSQNFDELAGVKKPLTTVPHRKPGRHEFFRVKAEDGYCLETMILEMKGEQTSYLVDQTLWPSMAGELTPKVLLTCLNRQGVLFLWSARLPGQDGRQDPWSRSALEAAQMAKTNWIRLAANMSLGAYDIFVASSDLPDPVWPNVSFEEILGIAFRDQFIKSIEHPVIRQLRGEI